MKNSVKCEFTSVWSDGSVVTTPCLYIPKTGKTNPKVSKAEAPSGTVEQEYITLPEGEQLEVCLECHKYVLNGSDCPNPSCGQSE